jgi:hypothetical protein
MSNELRISGSVRYIDATRKINKTLLQISQLMRDRNTTLMSEGMMNLTTTEAALALGDVTSPGDAVFLNLDSNLLSAIYIQVGFDISGTFRPALKIGPGKFQIVELEPTQTWKAKVTSSTGQLQFAIFQRNS